MQQLRQSLLKLDDAQALKALKVAAFAEVVDKDFDFVRAGMAQAAKFDPPPPPAQPSKD